MIFQSFNVFSHVTVGQNVILAPMLVKSLPKPEARKRAEKLLTRAALRRAAAGPGAAEH